MNLRPAKMIEIIRLRIFVYSTLTVPVQTSAIEIGPVARRTLIRMIRISAVDQSFFFNEANVTFPPHCGRCVCSIGTA